MTKAIKLAVGCSVEQIMPAPIRGVVDMVRVDEQALAEDPLNPKVLAHVVWDQVGEDGEPERGAKWFPLDALRVTKEAPPQEEEPPQA